MANKWLRPLPLLLLALLGGSHALSVVAKPPLSLLSTPPEALRSHFGWPGEAPTGQGARVKYVWGALRKGIDVLDLEDASSTKYLKPKLQRILAEDCGPITQVSLLTKTASEDGTQKLLLRLPDGLSVESVIIPMLGGKHTSLCVSSQVGCSRACAFCSTGTMGLVRSLTADEILSQVWHALRTVREADLPPLVNVVFMGMGEPLNNFKEVKRAVAMLTDRQAFGFSRRSVCVSTVAPNPKSIALAGTLPCRLAWSVHAADDTLRKLLVPTTVHPMETLRDAFLEALASKPGGDKSKALLVELALMKGLNDQIEHAEQLAALLHPFGRSDVLVNLIPYNENGLGLPNGELFQASRQEDIYAFQRHLWSKGILCTVRATRGEQERAACGQLATKVAEGAKRAQRMKRVQAASGL